MKSALLVIDMQNGFLSPRSPLFIAGAPATVPACARVIERCRDSGVLVVFVTRAYAADGSDVEKPRRAAFLAGGRPLSPGCDEEISAAMPKEFGASEKDMHIVKPRYSAFFNTGLDTRLKELGVGHVILAGTTTPNCIRTSCYDAISLDYDVTVLSDCTSSVNEEIQRSNLADMERAGARIMASAELVLD
ncbi:MAG: cysteine hydrolase [Oscillospiraceae bacterium]|nr:cysteine hydrolase [Oscillospiraceae bacterium]